MALPLHQFAVFIKRAFLVVVLFIVVWVVAKQFFYQLSSSEQDYNVGSKLMADEKLVQAAIDERFVLLREEAENSRRASSQSVEGIESASLQTGKTSLMAEDAAFSSKHLALAKTPPALAETPREDVQAMAEASMQPPCTNVHAFYYPWYGNPKIDGHYAHWNHTVLPHWDKEIDKNYKKYAHRPPNDIASDFYPELGAYSSRDPQVVYEHFSQLSNARIGVVAVSYYPAGTADENGMPWDDLYILLLDKAVDHGLKITFHIEPYKGRNEKTVRNDIIHIIDEYGSHKGFYKYKITNNKHVPLFYVYDSYLTKQEDWAKVLVPGGPNTIRGTKYDSMVIGLLVDMPHSSYASVGGFDGLYTYFASNGFTYGSKWDNWKDIAVRSHQMNFLFIPSVGPGYVDTNIRPWNSENARDRSDGVYYKNSWESALKVKPAIISITSFNEWHEGTQIEKAIPTFSESRNYFDYKPFGSDYYIKLTKNFVDKYHACQT